MNINNIKDVHSIPFVVIPTKQSTDPPDEYILGYVGDQVNSPLKSDEENGIKVEVDTEENDNKLLLKCIIEDYKSNDIDDVFTKSLISKKKKYHIDDKKIINHLLSELPEKDEESNDDKLIKKEIDLFCHETILVDLVPALPSENNFQASQQKVSLPLKKKDKKNVCNSQDSQEVIQLDDEDSMDSGGNCTTLETEVSKPIVSNSRNNPLAVQSDNAASRPSMEEPINCESVTSHNLAKQKDKKNVCKSQASQEVIQLDGNTMDSEGNCTTLETEVLEPIVSNSKNNPLAAQSDNAGSRPSIEEPIDCESVTSHNLPKQKYKKSVCNTEGSQEVIQLDDDTMDSEGNCTTLETEKTKNNACNSQGSPEIIQLDDDSMDSEGNGAEMEIEVLEPVVSNSRNNPLAAQSDNAGNIPSMEEPIDCESVTSHNLANQRVPAPKKLSVDSYCRMITRAILSSPGRCISLKNLFSFISRNYSYNFKKTDGWQAPIKKYLWQSHHFVKALPKNFVEGSTEMWILNPATERKMISRFIRRSADKIQVNQFSLGRQNVKSSNLKHLLCTNSTTPNNNNAYKRMQFQRETIAIQRECVSAPPVSRPTSFSSMLQKQLSNSKCNKPLKNFSKSFDNWLNQKFDVAFDIEKHKDKN